MTVEQLGKMSSRKMEDVDINTLVEVNSVRYDESLSTEKKVEKMIARTGNPYFRRSRRQFIFSVLLHREMVGVAFFQVGKQQIDGALIFLVVLAGFAGVDKFQQGNKVHFLGGGFVPDVAHQRAIQKPFCLYPKILRAFFSLTFGIRYQRIYQLQNIFLAADIHKGVVVHRFFEVNRIQYLNAVARPLQQLPALNQNRTFRVG